jgi:allantoate deiminase
MMNDLDPAELGRRAEAMLEELAAISAEPDRLVRLFLSPEHRRAADLVAQWMREIGLEVFEDEIGNVRGRIGKPPYLILGSHIDTVIDAGRYDGPLGVVAPILAVDALRRLNALPPIGIELVAFGDEEGSRFHSTLPSSAAMAGHFDPRHFELTDSEGVSFTNALRAYGKDPTRIATAAVSPGEAAAFVEVHIEQGPVLETEDQPLAVVTAIVGQTRLQATVAGVAGHAGTVPMRLRNDALAGAAEMILLAERIAGEYAEHGMVATVGRIEARPGAANIISGVVRFTLDLRTASDAARDNAITRFEAEARAIAERRRLGLAIDPIHRIATTPAEAAIQDQLANAVMAVGARPLKLASGAGHDGLMMSKLCPIGMLFVRCKAGVSHNPLEYASPADMGMAVAALVQFIQQFKPEDPNRG